MGADPVISVELVRQARRKRTWLALLAVVIVPIIIVTALAINGPPRPEPGEGPFLLDVATRSGINFALFALVATSQFLLVVVVALFAGDSLPSEASWGSLRYLLTRPVARSRLLTTKLSVASMYALAAVALVPVVSVIVGTMAFGWSGTVTPLGSQLDTGSSLARLLAATVYVAWDMATVVAIAFLLSTTTDAPLGAVGGAVIVIVVSEILDAITALGVVRYALPTHYWLSWTAMLEPAGNTAEMARGALQTAVYTAVALGVAWWWFGRKDVLS